MKKLMVLLMAVCLFGCVSAENKSPISTTNSVFKTFQTVYIGGMGAMGDLYKQSKISEEQKIKIIELGKEFKLAYQAAAVAFETYAGNPSIQNKEQMDALLKNTEFLKDEFMRRIYERQ